MGLSLFGVGEALLVRSRAGATPWTVFAQGLSLQTGISIGWATFLISAGVLLAWLPLRQKPGLGTIMNMIVIALVLNVAAIAIPSARAVVAQALYAVAGVAVIGLGSALYLTTGLGPGPRDGLMTGIHRQFKVSVVYTRLGIELVVLIMGWLMGGTVGLATAFFAATIGFAIGVNLSVVDFVSKLGVRRANR